MEARNPMQKSKKRKPKLEHSFNMEKVHILHITGAKAVSPSSFTNMLVLPDMLEFIEISWLSISCGIHISRGNLCNSYYFEIITH